MALHLIDAVVECDPETAQIYEMEDPDNPLEFPLARCIVHHTGDRASIQVQRTGQKARYIDRLINAPAPEKSTSRDGETDTYVFTGQSEKLYLQGVNPEDGVVTFRVKATKTTGVTASASVQ